MEYEDELERMRDRRRRQRQRQDQERAYRRTDTAHTRTAREEGYRQNSYAPENQRGRRTRNHNYDEDDRFDHNSRYRDADDYEYEEYEDEYNDGYADDYEDDYDGGYRDRYGRRHRRRGSSNEDYEDDSYDDYEEDRRRKSQSGPRRKKTKIQRTEVDQPSSKGKAGKGRTKKRKKHKFLFLLLLIAALAAGYFVYQYKQTGSGLWTVAVFGVDSRDGTLEKNALSDVEMLCVIDRGSGEIKLVSVFRDTYLEINPDGTYHKINEAYFKGGHEQAVQALERNLDLTIDDYATFNWKAVADAINILGGIDLEISDSEFAYINSFITETVESTGVGSHHLEHGGMNHLDGVQAVAYARLRLMDTDYNRTARQRLVIQLAMNKAKETDLKTLTTLVQAIMPQISTSIGIDDVIPLARNIRKFHIGETGGFPFSRGETHIGKKDCVIPLTLESNVIQLHQFLYGTENYQPSQTVKQISAKIASDSGMGEVAENAPEAKVLGQRALEGSDDASSQVGSGKSESVSGSSTAQSAGNDTPERQPASEEISNTAPEEPPSEAALPEESSSEAILPEESSFEAASAEETSSQNNEESSSDTSSSDSNEGQGPDSQQPSSETETSPSVPTESETEIGPGMTQESILETS